MHDVEEQVTPAKSLASSYTYAHPLSIIFRYSPLHIVGSCLLKPYYTCPLEPKTIDPVHPKLVTQIDLQIIQPILFS
jgi:hypothetical protein